MEGPPFRIQRGARTRIQRRALLVIGANNEHKTIRFSRRTIPANESACRLVSECEPAAPCRVLLIHDRHHGCCQRGFEYSGSD